METAKEMLIKSMQEVMGYEREEAEKYAERIVELGKELLKEDK